jgi:Caspase domain
VKKAIVAIGVNRTGELPVLGAAVAGAEKFAEWAGKQHFDVELLTDGNGSSVTIDAIKFAIKRFVDARTYSQLIVYFGGHGVLQGPNNELWLLSGAPGNPTEAVQVWGSIYNARESGISHLVFISDACRSTPNSLVLNAVTGTTVFPNNRPRRRRPEVDVFYATLPGDPAYEASLGQSPANYRGLFTECLLNALVQAPAEVMEYWASGARGQWVIPSWKLRPYLQRVVPDAAAAVSLQYDQAPDIIVESHPPTCLIQCPNYQPPTDAKPESVGPPAEPASLLEVVDKLPDDPRALAVKKSGRRWPLPEGFNTKAAQHLLGALGRGSKEMTTGFAICGTKVQRVTAGNTELKCFKENDATQVKVVWSQPARPGASLLVQFGKGNGAVLPILKEFIGTVVVDGDERVVNVSYAPSGNSAYANEQRSELQKRHAYIAAAARTGAFKVAEKDATKLAEYLRALKSVDPTLGLYAAYAYAQAGVTEEVDSVYQHMNVEGSPPVPFDVALLARKLPSKGVLSSMQEVAPFCPMLTQGWALLEPYLDRLAPQVVQARHHLVPALWTTLNAPGVELLWTEMQNGGLR